MGSRPQSRFGSVLKPMRGDDLERSPDSATAMASDIFEKSMSSKAYFVLRRWIWAGLAIVFGHGCAARGSSAQAWTLPERASGRSDPWVVIMVSDMLVRVEW